MKKLSWQQWTGIGLLIAFVVCVVVLHLVQPQVSFAFTEIISVVTFVGGLVIGYLFNKKKDTTTDKQLLLD